MSRVAACVGLTAMGWLVVADPRGQRPCDTRVASYFRRLLVFIEMAFTPVQCARRHGLRTRFWTLTLAES